MKKILIILLAVVLPLSVCVPAAARTSASYGYLEGLYSAGGAWFARFDLVTVTYEAGYTSDIAYVTNESAQTHEYPLAANCLLYSCDAGITTRCDTPEAFLSRVEFGSACYVFYLNDEIVTIADAE